MCEAPVKASGRMVRLALNSSSVAAVVAFSGRVFHSLVDLGKSWNSQLVLFFHR